MTRLTLDHAKALARSKGGECLSDKYVDVHTPLKWKCQNGHIWDTCYHNVKYKNWCRICHTNSRKLGIDCAMKIAVERGGKCLSTEYKDCNSHLTFECQYGHTWEASLNSVKNTKSWCPYCANNRKLTIDHAKKLALQKGGLCLSTTYINAISKLLWRCNKNHEWKARYNDIQSGYWCPTCGGILPLNINDARETARLKGGECLSNDYINCHLKLRWRCQMGHEWNACLATIKNKNTWCPVCRQSKGEELISHYLDELGILYQRQKSWDECRYKKPLKFDFYIPEYNVLIEFDGEQHFRPVDHFGGQHKFIETIDRDTIKLHWTYYNGKSLIRIAYVEVGDIEDIIDEMFDNLTSGYKVMYRYPQINNETGQISMNINLF